VSLLRQAGGVRVPHLAPRQLNTSRALRCDVSRSDYLGPLLGFIGDELAELAGLDASRYQSARNAALTGDRPIHLALTRLQTNADFASFIVGEVNAGLFKDFLYL
jgi:hypothetical protein